MPGTRAERIFEELKQFLSPGSIWQKVLVLPTRSFKKFWYPYHKVENSSKHSRTPFTTLH